MRSVVLRFIVFLAMLVSYVSPAHASDVKPNVFGGVLDERAEHDNVVALRVGSNDSSFKLCTGTLVSSNLVVTAKHCVVHMKQDKISCDSDGRSANGPHTTGHTEDPKDVMVFLGVEPNFADNPRARAETIIVEESNVLCNNDVAFVVLDKHILEVEPITIGYGSLQQETPVRVVGYGKTETNAIGKRFSRNVEVAAVGPAYSHIMQWLGANEFEFEMSACNGDSGGPVIDVATGALAGVVSRGSGCDERYGHIATRADAFEDLTRKAVSAGAVEPSRINLTTEMKETREVEKGCNVSGESTKIANDFFYVFAFFCVAFRLRRAR